MGKRKQIDCSVNARLLWFYMLHLFLLSLQCACCLWMLTFCLSCVLLLLEPCSCPCSLHAPLLSSSGKCRVIKALQCCVSTQQIKNFSKFLSCLRGELAHSKLTGFMGDLCTLMYLFPRVSGCASDRCWEKIYRNSKYLPEWWKYLRII